MIKPFIIIFFLTILTFATDMKLQNKMIPMPFQIDKYTRLINIQTEKSTITYTYEIDTAIMTNNSLKQEDRTTIIKSVTKTSCSKSKQFLEANISLNYLYKHAQTKDEIFNFHINNVSCFSL